MWIFLLFVLVVVWTVVAFLHMVLGLSWTWLAAALLAVVVGDLLARRRRARHELARRRARGV